MNAFVAKNRLECIMQGGARGADAMAREWAEVKGVELLTFPADWGKDKKAAGPIRNQRMVTEGRPHCVIAFPGTTGTDDMKRRARRAGILVLEASFEW